MNLLKYFREYRSFHNVLSKNILKPKAYVGLREIDLGLCWNSSYFSIRNNCSGVENIIYDNSVKYWSSIAIEDENRKYAYGEIFSKSLQLSEGLNAILQKGKQKNLAFLLPNNVSYVISQWAAWRSGHVVVPLHPSHPPAQLKYYIEDSQASLIITTEALASKFSSFLSGQQVTVLEDSFLHSKDEEQLNENEKNAQQSLSCESELRSDWRKTNALIIYTSGTTGPPKGVVLTHANLQSQVYCLLESWGWTSNDVLLHCLPLHHIHGIVNALHCPLYCGARLVMEPAFNASSVWSRLLDLSADVSSRVNVFMAVPTIYAKLIEEYERSIVKNMRRGEFVKKTCMENLRLMVSGSAPLPNTLLKKWESITGHILLERYGMTEIGMALSNPLNGRRVPGFVGTPLPSVEVKIVRFSPKRDSCVTICEGNQHGTKVTPGLEEEQDGELLVKGPNVFHEYWQKEEETKKEFTEDGWFCTGDTAVFINGNYKILGRTSVDIIKSGGFKVSALDVERQLLTHSKISDVAVFGLPDLTWGEKVAAVIVWKGKSEFSLKKFRAWAKELLPHYQVPAVVKVLQDEIPRNNMGKVDKRELIRQYFPKQSSQSS